MVNSLVAVFVAVVVVLVDVDVAFIVAVVFISHRFIDLLVESCAFFYATYRVKQKLT